ncbi:hypothetical protein ABTN18_19425, partial [Acinetobacter baumannii]
HCSGSRMKPSKQTHGMPHAKAIKEIEKRLAELERMRQHVECEARDEADKKPLPRKGSKQAH